MSAPIRLILADDHPIVRQGLRQIIEADDALAIVAEASDGKAALAAIQTHPRTWSCWTSTCRGSTASRWSVLCRRPGSDQKSFS